MPNLTHKNYDVEWIKDDGAQSSVSVRFFEGHYEDQDGEQVYVRDKQVGAETIRFSESKTQEEIINYLNKRLTDEADETKEPIQEETG